MRFIKWVGCWILSYVLLLVFSALFMDGAYMILAPIVAPIIGSIIYKATTPPRMMDDTEYADA